MLLSLEEFSRQNATTQTNEASANPLPPEAVAFLAEINDDLRRTRTKLSNAMHHLPSNEATIALVDGTLRMLTLCMGLNTSVRSNNPAELAKSMAALRSFDSITGQIFGQQ